jgi:hypothetical protein
MGAAGFLAEDIGDDELVHAVQTVHSGGQYLPPCMAPLLDAPLPGVAGAPAHARLSKREHQVLVLLAGARTVRAIARGAGDASGAADGDVSGTPTTMRYASAGENRRSPGAQIRGRLLTA